MAALDGDAEVTPRHVDEAASLVGMAARPPTGSNGHSNGHPRARREPPTVPSPAMPSGTVPLRPAPPPAAPGARGNGWTPRGPHGKDDIKARVGVIGGDKARLTPEKGAPVLGGHDGAAGSRPALPRGHRATGP